ncbi:MAG: Spy/CpxP family protein refolding chaperone [Gemmataceae bacterium]|nr:Spy/CpxP family protein refolding chaperone [Gemmataceae bacterium]
MFRFGSVALWLGLALFLTPFASGADDEKKPGKGKFGGQIGQGQPLLSAEAMEKLKLSSEQKEKITKLVKDFEDKSKDLTGKIREDLQKAIQDKDKDAIKSAAEKMRDVREQAGKLRTEFEGKLTGLLTDEQKKKFEEIKKEQPQPRPFGGKPQPGNRPGPGQLLPPELQDELKLTSEQKEKIAKLQKELEGKLNDVLTDEQKKKLEELKKGGRPLGKRPAKTANE